MSRIDCSDCKVRGLCEETCANGQVSARIEKITGGDSEEEQEVYDLLCYVLSGNEPRKR
jgi:hypothetical protein